MRTLNRKSGVVRFYEVGLGKMLENHGINMIPIYPYEELRFYALQNWEGVLKDFSNTREYKRIHQLLRENMSINPTHALWRFLLHQNFLLVKKQLLFVNPTNMPDIKYLDLNQAQNPSLG